MKPRMLEVGIPDHRATLIDLCHFIQEKEENASIRKACTIFAELSGMECAFYFDIDQSAQKFRLVTGVDTGNVLFTPPQLEIDINFRALPISPLTQAVMQGRSLNLDGHFGGYHMAPLSAVFPGMASLRIVPLRNENNTIYGLLAGVGRAKIALRPRYSERMEATLMSSIGALIDLRQRHKRAMAQSKTMSADIRGLSESRSALAKRNKNRRMRIRGKSPAIARARKNILAYAEDDRSVVIVGPRGSRREDVGRDIHDVSSFLNGRFIHFDCGTPAERAIPELVGYKRGGIPGMNSSRRGLLREATAGVLYLDNLERCDVSLQDFLLRLLDTREFRAIGSERAQRVETKMVFGVENPQNTGRENPVTTMLNNRIIIPNSLATP